MSTTLKKFAAPLGAGVLSLAMFGTALAATGPSDQGVTPTEHEGNIKLVVTEGGQVQAACDLTGDEENPREGVEGGDSSGTATSPGGVTVTWVYNPDTKAISFTATGGLVTIAYIKGGNVGYNEYDYVGDLGGGVASDGNLFAPDNPSEVPAGLSHLVFCTGPASEGSEAPTTDTPSEPAFSAEEGGLSDAPTEPNTSSIGGISTSGPADGAWLLVVALGVLLASVVVMTPARAKTRR